MSSKDKYVEVPFQQTRKVLHDLERAIGVVAASRIKVGLTTNEFETETARIERCLEAQYKTLNVESDFNEFALAFVKENVKDLVYSPKYAGTYLEDVQNVFYRQDLSKEEE